MSSVDSNRFGAAGSALGYLAQVEYALLIALQRMDTEDRLKLSLETVDDISFEVEGRPQELWQTKHHVGVELVYVRPGYVLDAVVAEIRLRACS